MHNHFSKIEFIKNKKSSFLLALIVLFILSFVLLTWKPIYAKINLPVASGTETYENNSAIIDASHLSNGYVMIKYMGDNRKIKIRIIKNIVYTYALNARKNMKPFR